MRFDADGNMIHGPLNGGMADFSFDSRNRLTGAGNTQYFYDAENQRIAVNADGQETRYTVNSQPLLSQVLTKTRPDGTQTYYVYGLGLIGEESAAGYKTYHFDFRGSTAALSDDGGVVVERFRYSAFGVLLAGDASKTPFLFNGQYGVMTDTNGLYYMRARFYSPEIKRFLNQDVLLGAVAEGQTLNRFAFVTGRPVSFVDPWGLAPITSEKAKELFKILKQMDLAFNNPRAGCESRAHFMLKKLMDINENKGLDMDLFKTWAFSDPAGKRMYVQEWKSNFAWWGMHVAPSVTVLVDGTETNMILDPTLFPAGPVTQEVWRNKLVNELYTERTLPGQPPAGYPGSYVPGNPDSTYPTDGWWSRGTMDEEARKVINCAKTKKCWGW